PRGAFRAPRGAEPARASGRAHRPGKPRSGGGGGLADPGAGGGAGGVGGAARSTSGTTAQVSGFSGSTPRPATSVPLWSTTSKATRTSYGAAPASCGRRYSTSKEGLPYST